MTSRDPTAWMWAEACQMIEQAERLQRQFFRLGHGQAHASWEPPVDVFEDEREVTVIVALPGVSPESVEASCDARGIAGARGAPHPVRRRLVRDPASGDTVWLVRAAHPAAAGAARAGDAEVAGRLSDRDFAQAALSERPA